VHTAETTRLRYFIDLLLLRKRPVMLVGAAGTGKTVLINDRVSSLGEDDYMVTNIPFNFYTTSEMLQHVMEQPLEKKAGRNYGPPGTKSLIYFVDDMNMPEVSSYYLATLCRLECPQHDGMHGHTPHPRCSWLQPGPGHVFSVSTCGRDKGGGGWVRSASWYLAISPPPDMCLPVIVLKKEFTIQTLAAIALAVYIVIEHRSKACATEVKP